jgi:AraC-like DNA-binding protein
MDIYLGNSCLCDSLCFQEIIMPAVQKEKVFRSTGEGRGRPIRPFFQDFHRLRMRGSQEYPLHQHSSYEVILVDQGPYTCLLNGVELTVSSQEMLVIKPGDWHQDHLQRGQQHYVLHFSLGDALASPVALFADGVAPSAQIAVSPLAEEPKLFQTLEKEAARGDEFSAGIQDATLEAFFWRLVRSFPAESLSPQFRQRSVEQEFIGRLYQLFEELFQNSLSVDEMAQRMQTSRRSLSMKCRELLGDSPARLFARYKVQKAVQLLMYTGRPVKEIAYDLGFENPYHFSRVFKTFYGAAPSSLRK